MLFIKDEGNFKSFHSIRTNSSGTCVILNCREPEQPGTVISAGTHARVRCWHLTSESLWFCCGAISGFESVQLKPGTHKHPRLLISKLNNKTCRSLSFKKNEWNEDKQMLAMLFEWRPFGYCYRTNISRLYCVLENTNGY